MIALYFAVGIGFYLGLALKDPKGFINADSAAIIRGLLLGVVFWPIGMIVQTYLSIEALNEKKGKN